MIFARYCDLHQSEPPEQITNKVFCGIDNIDYLSDYFCALIYSIFNNFAHSFKEAFLGVFLCLCRNIFTSGAVDDGNFLVLRHCKYHFINQADQIVLLTRRNRYNLGFRHRKTSRYIGNLTLNVLKLLWTGFMAAFIPLTERFDLIALIEYEEKHLALLNVRFNDLLEEGLIRRHGAVIRLDDPQRYIKFRKDFAVQLCVFAITVFVLANTRDIHQSNFFPPICSRTSCGLRVQDFTSLISHTS